MQGLLRRGVARRNVGTWLEGATLELGDRARLVAGNAYQAAWLRDHYAEQIAEVLRETLGRPTLEVAISSSVREPEVVEPS